MQIADGLSHAPHWPASAYESALNPNAQPPRVALVVEALESETVAPSGPEPGTPSSAGVLGFVVASLVAGEAELESIAVATEAQRRGLGGRLLHELVAALRQPGVTMINLEVRASNRPALGLYAWHGFRETGRRVAYYADPVEDAVLMGLDLGGHKWLQNCDSGHGGCGSCGKSTALK
jgi:ribosomal-protein-alanine N-acetyltransferase